MSFKKFSQDDVFISRVKMHPEWDFFIYNSEIFINDSQNISGSLADTYKNVPAGFVSLYEYNLNRSGSFIHPFVDKDANYKTRFRKDLKSMLGTRKDNSTTWPSLPSEIVSSYRMSASITRKFLEPSNLNLNGGVTISNHHNTTSVLRNMCHQYQTINPSFSNHNSALNSMFTKNVNMINIPSVFYGSEIKKGSLTLNYYLTGTLIATAKDIRHNGQLICTFGTSSVSGSVIGHVLYREGIMFFPSSSATTSSLEDSGLGIVYQGSAASASWLYFGRGANDSWSGANKASASFSINFEGTTYKNNMTLFCHADKGRYNYSNNPTFLNIEQSASINRFMTSSYTYYDFETDIENIASSSFHRGEDEFRKVTYISKIGIYDEKDNLIMTVDLARPYRKEENDDLTFKIKYDLL